MLKFVILINLLAYGFIVSQAFFYLLALGNATRKLNAPAYVELRILLDTDLTVTLKIVYYLCLVSSITLAVMTAGNPSGILFITSSIACIALWIDVYLMFKGNIPINKMIRSWTPELYPSNWKDFREAWMNYYHRRQACAIIGFVSLLIGIIWSI